jgi:Fe2+ or Zn2+ uptake regulation protein
MRESPEVPRRRKTRQRALIYAIVASTDAHPTADWIYERARESMPSLSLGTVYRNLQVLARDGKIRAIDAWGKTARYDADLSTHYHFVCTGCGAIRDVPRPARQDARLAGLFTLPGFSVTGHSLEFQGLCASCSRSRKGDESPRSAKKKGKEKPCPVSTKLKRTKI